MCFSLKIQNPSIAPLRKVSGVSSALRPLSSAQYKALEEWKHGWIWIRPMDMDMDKADAIFLFAGHNKYKYTSENTKIQIQQ